MKEHEHASNLVSLDAWLKELDKTRSTGWRWRKQGHIKTVNVFGKVYITRDEIAAFEGKVIAGDFSRECSVPLKTAA